MPSVFFVSKELFHGPTFAFKDVALQMLGNFFEYFLRTGSNEGKLAVLGATSGDTGSAAMAGLKGKAGVECIILFPQGRVSHRQELQMTTVPEANVYAVAVQNATFDDCQDIVKASFKTPAFKNAVHLGAVNSINWCRVLAQTTYYFWSYLRVTDDAALKHKEVHYSVPTGNFGDVLAGYYAKQMGLPVGRLIVATNENDILHRFFTTGIYHRHQIQESLSPSMDICVSSNFERYLFHLSGNNPTQLAAWMHAFETSADKKLTVAAEFLQRAQADFTSARVDTTETLQTISEYYAKYSYVLCPHTAVGVQAAKKVNLLGPSCVCLATAHEGKFPDAVARALGEENVPAPPQELASLEVLPVRCVVLPNDLQAVQAFVRECCAEKKKKDWVVWTRNAGIVMWVLAGVVAVAVQISRRR